MKVRNLGTDDLRKVCKTLVETDGDVIVTAQTHGLPPEFVKKIKKGEYLPSVTSSFFSPDRWRDPAPGCTEPDPVQLTIDEEPKEEKEMSVPTTTETKINRRQGTPEATIRRICERLCEGTHLNKEIAKEVGVSENVVSMVKIKKRYTDISDEYFKYVNDHQYKVLKTGKIIDINARSLALMKTNPLTNVEKKTNVDVQPSNVEVKKTETKTTVSATVVTSDENDIINEIINLATKVVGSKKISELPEHMQVKVLEAIRSDIENMSLKEIKELCNV